MGYEDDFDLTKDIYGEKKTNNRKYRTSFIGTFAQNIGFVLFECSNSEKKIITLHQEKPVTLDKCGGKMECDWEEFKDIFEDEMSCPWDDICSMGCIALSAKYLLTVVTLFMSFHSLAVYC